MESIYDFTREELTARFLELGERSFRADQVFNWLYQRDVRDFDAMTNISRGLREQFGELFTAELPEIARESGSDDGTRKLALRLSDGEMVESVLIPDDERTTLCISSQVGCRLGCTFCATATMGLKRNLTAGEIVSQYLVAKGAASGRITNIVFMGMGEPLDNFENVKRALDILFDQGGIDFSHRKVTVSTAGITPKLAELAADPKLQLAISLSAADQETRRKLMPISKRYTLESLLEVIRSRPRKMRERLTISYVMFAGVNDSKEDAAKLAKLLKGQPVKINLIAYNRTDHADFRRPSEATIDAFMGVLVGAGLQAMVRKSRGSDKAAACGQLVIGEGE